MHGLVYPPNLLNSLPILDTDIHSINSATFAQLHLQHALSHPPDNILFPFLHGLEGDNHAQNAFFATSNSAHNNLNTRITPKIPKYRGLVWVVCEDDLEHAGDLVSLRILRRKPVISPVGKTSSSSSSSYSASDEEDVDDDDDEDFDDEDDDLEMMSMSMSMDLDDRSSYTGDDDDVVLASPIFNSQMQVDDVAVVAPDSSPLVEHTSGPTVNPTGADTPAASADPVLLDLHRVFQQKEEQMASHMHPIHHRPAHLPTTLPLPIPLPSIITQPQTHAFISSPASNNSSTSVSPVSIFDTPVGTEAESLSSAAPSECPTQPSSSQPLPPTQTQHTQTQTSQTDPYAPPLLTSTFRPKELLRRIRVGKSDPHPSLSGNGAQQRHHTTSKWEFVPVQVPDGISLRNFGVQVPIYATLSDIVVYSPKGVSPTAIALARRFRAAMKTKREERLRATASFRNGAEDKGTRTGAGGLGSPQPQGPPVLSISTSTSSITFASAINSQSNPNSTYISNPISDASVNATVPDTGPSLNANAISKATVHTKASINGNGNGYFESDSAKPEEDDILEYNVFVLDATAEDLRREVPYLMMRMCGPGVPGGTTASSSDLEVSKIRTVAKAKANTTSLTKAKTEPSISPSPPTSNGARHVQRNPLFDVGAHTDGPDGHLVEEGIVEKREMERARKRDMDLDVVADMDIDMDMDDENGVDVDAKNQEEEDDILLPNTVDFALREKEEMRDLTKASEIISLYPEPSLSVTSTPSSPPSSTKPGFTNTWIPTPSPTPVPPQPETLETKSVWNPLVGQVYLGNSGDVPLAPDVPNHFRHAASLVRDTTLTGDPCVGLDGYFSSDDDEDDFNSEAGSSKELSADDLFNYYATNDPMHGFGYDIAVECHELAPFPSTAHLRAADEHLGMLDLLWKERWERGWRAREEKKFQKRKATAQDYTRRNPPPAPPRPPPHANAVIHLPFPSSPSNSQTTMVSLMHVIKFLEKWLKPAPLPVVPPPPPPPPPVTARSGTVTPEMKSLKLNGSGDAAGTQGLPPSPPSPTTASARRWSSVAALMPSFPSFPLGTSASAPANSNNNSEPNGVNPNLSTAAHIPPLACPLPARHRSFTSPASSQFNPKSPQQTRTRPLKILLYSSDGYTESSVPALCLLMAIKSLNLPEAYLELQVVKRRSFFVYHTDLGILRRVEARLKEERERERERERGRERERERLNGGFFMGGTRSVGSINANGKRMACVRGGNWSGIISGTGPEGSSSSYPGATTTTPSTPPVGGGGASHPSPPSQKSSFTGRPAAKSVSFAHAPQPMMVPSPHQQQHEHDHDQPAIPSQPHLISGASYLGQVASPASLPTQSNVPHQMPHQQPGAGYSAGSGYQEGHQVIKGRPRANTSPWLPSLFGGDHQSWFNDPRFDGSFPSRVLPFLYLGNLNHASNVYMLHALGITHVVSVGECALVPPPHHMPGGGGGMNQVCHRPVSNAHFIAGQGPGGHGSLWIEEREGRIKVLDIKGVCDDGIDTLEPQLEPVCDWIDKARQEGGQVLVHCRVGVSRSATVTIAYVMKHLGLPLVDAYLIVRSRRLSVLIQPNMRLLYNLCGWEIKLAKERANGDERKIKKELARTLTWPYLAKEVHALNDKYLR